MIWTLGPAFLHSILHSLVSREDLKNLLAGKSPKQMSQQAMDNPPIPLSSVDEGSKRGGDGQEFFMPGIESV